MDEKLIYDSIDRAFEDAVRQLFHVLFTSPEAGAIDRFETGFKKSLKCYESARAVAFRNTRRSNA